MNCNDDIEGVKYDKCYRPYFNNENSKDKTSFISNFSWQIYDSIWVTNIRSVTRGKLYDNYDGSGFIQDLWPLENTTKEYLSQISELKNNNFLVQNTKALFLSFTI